jgi:hypothetical protein
MKYPKMASCPRIFFAENEWNYQSYESKFSKLFRRARQAVVGPDEMNLRLPAALLMQVRNRNPLLRSEGNPFQDEDNCPSTMMLQQVRPKGPGCLPKSSPIITQWVGADKRGGNGILLERRTRLLQCCRIL